MNMRDGRVRVRAEGPREIIDELVRALEKGPPLSRVERVEVRWLPADRPLRRLRHPLRGVRALSVCAGARVGCLAAAALVLLSAGGVAAEPRGGPYTATEQRTHVVVKGDTLAAIARRYNVSVAALVNANRLPNETRRSSSSVSA